MLKVYPFLKFSVHVYIYNLSPKFLAPKDAEKHLPTNPLAHE